MNTNNSWRMNKVMRALIFVNLFLLFGAISYAQKVNKEDSTMLRKIYDTALLEGKSYQWLDYLSNNIGGRLSGSLEAEKAVQYTKEQLDKLGFEVLPVPCPSGLGVFQNTPILKQHPASHL